MLPLCITKRWKAGSAPEKIPNTPPDSTIVAADLAIRQSWSARLTTSAPPPSSQRADLWVLNYSATISGVMIFVPPRGTAKGSCPGSVFASTDCQESSTDAPILLAMK
jgi:hypothetical protein